MTMKNANTDINIPMPLRPSGKDYLWGGKRLNTEFTRNIDMTMVAESWECSTHPDGPSYLPDDSTLTQFIENNPQVLGLKHDGETTLPVLIKFIDARADLSIQVHPDDRYARENENGQLGKTEMWYVLDATKDAKLVYGFNKNCTKEEVKEALDDGSIMDRLQVVDIRKNDVFFINSGTVHAIGAGALIAEIQESSNLTYRMYDYDRVDRFGNRRELHIDKALDVMNLSSSAAPRQPMRVLNYRAGVASELLSRCKYFEVYRMIVNTERRQLVHYRADEFSYRVLLCISGCGIIRYDGGEITFYKGDCIFVPADSVDMTLHGKAEFLDVRG